MFKNKKHIFLHNNFLTVRDKKINEEKDKFLEYY